ncbi:type I-F CRISPR-associated protein Csy2 [Pontibacterium granulatum]|uniref:type I-F CRISPR-associated protein Csy2 n=1 Tax=Pontibacterium granulatum TaxID=2036029 RepID=UPI00249AE112|nr:type I-F CRISPR-associated protein Csy2 [Pontibacterium granulatum]MDI3323426.1 type I-F CRISPR-associated protein Csy2 [Pontibacterium granulatum]
MSDTTNLLILPRLRIQNANAISSPMTWGFPAMSAFIGFIHALERKLPEEIDLEFKSIGVICHQYQAQTTQDFVHRFNLTRNPVDKAGKSAAIVEEGRIHLEVTLVLSVEGEACLGERADRDQVANEVAKIASGMRIAGGCLIPESSGKSRSKPELIPLSEDSEEKHKQFRRLKMRWLPGFALVLRDDLLHAHHEKLAADNSESTLLDAWLDLSRLNIECRQTEVTDEKGNTQQEVNWQTRRAPGWIVPIPVGYGALSRLYEAGSVANTRDNTTPFRFVESLYSVGQWVSPHRLQSIDDMLWYVDNDLDAGLYRLNNDFRTAAAITD